MEDHTKMNCTKESIWFNFTQHLLYQLLPVVLFVGSFKSQGSPTEGTWQMKLEVDNYFSIRNAWSSDEISASVVVYDSTGTKHYALSLITIADEWNHFDFPDDFIALSDEAKSTALQPQMLIFELREKRNVKLRKSFFYDPSPNALLQLEFFPFREKLDTSLVWGNLIDAYHWEDIKGNNVVVRSQLVSKSFSEDSIPIFKKYLYLYHFRLEEEQLHLVRKFTDSYEGCHHVPNASFSLPSIELTDINRDTIGEINTIYDLYCSGGDTLVYHSKLLMASDGMKFMLDYTLDPCLKEEKTLKTSKSSSFKFHPYLLRFMQAKLHNYHFPE